MRRNGFDRIIDESIRRYINEVSYETIKSASNKTDGDYWNYSEDRADDVENAFDTIENAISMLKGNYDGREREFDNLTYKLYDIKNLVMRKIKQSINFNNEYGKRYFSLEKSLNDRFKCDDIDNYSDEELRGMLSDDEYNYAKNDY